MKTAYNYISGQFFEVYLILIGSNKTMLFIDNEVTLWFDHNF